MRFQTKIIIGYAIFAFALALIIGFTYHSYMVSQYKRTEATSMQVVAEQLQSQMEERLSRMELAAEYILSDPTILESIQILGRADDAVGMQYLEYARNAIQSGMNTYYISNNFYRAIWFNHDGEMFCTYNPLARRTKSEVDFDAMPYLAAANANTGEPILINAHEDPWGLQQNPQVFSLLKVIQGKNMGYIEVQYLVSDFEDLQVPKDELSYLIIVNEDELLYASNMEESLTAYEGILAAEGAAVQSISRDEGQMVLAAKAVSAEYPFTIIVLEDMQTINEASDYIAPMTLVIALAFFVVSMLFGIILSQFLTRPLRQLKVVMENTQLETLGQDIAVNTPDDEIQALSVSYQDVLERLKKSMVKEQRLSMLQLQAQFDSLQAQVNPHFLYNVLNIMSARGMAGGDETLCEMCDALAAMLRYSTNNKRRYATLDEELEYLEQYFYLLKARYEHKIVFKVEVAEAIRKVFVPKVALQQIVENCINHGFANSTEQMEVKIYGCQEGKRWYITVYDNGQGFSEEVLHGLRSKMEKTKKRILEERSNVELEIGGMGLINTYARCLLLYNDKLTFEIRNGEQGAEVTVGAEFNEEE